MGVGGPLVAPLLLCGQDLAGGTPPHCRTCHDTTQTVVNELTWPANQCITAVQEGEDSEDNQAARECIVEILQIIETVITTVFITAKVRTEILPGAVVTCAYLGLIGILQQFRERPEYLVTMVRFFEFVSVMLPVFSSVWDAGWEERLENDEVTSTRLCLALVRVEPTLLTDRKSVV